MNSHNNRKDNLAPAQHSVLGKRIQHHSREPSRDRSNPTKKRPRHLALSSINQDQICDECARIPWDKIDEWITHEGRIAWQGKLIVNVTKRYRNGTTSKTCPICRLLHCSWIKPYVDSLHPSKWNTRKGGYFGDRLHIFRHLRHNPHVNDFQTSRNELRKHNAAYHIAVVPFGREWRDHFEEHIASHGMVIVVPKDRPQSEIFNPQQVSKKFDPNVVLPWLEVCKGHKNLCNPKPAMVKGMKVIDCLSGTIQYHNGSENYVALSYVWGPAPSKAPMQELTGNETPKREIQTSTVVKKDHAATAPENKSLSRLPSPLPLTIEDAMQVTKALGYHYLWVDAYCIDQDSTTEKQEQVGRMNEIYAGSQVTIFALGPNSNHGLPGVSSRPRVWQRRGVTLGKCKLILSMADPHISINDSKWSTRGWTFQEAMFSTRRLFFTDDQVYFECNAMNCLEALKSNMKHLHIQSGQRVRAYHRAGVFVSGNSNKFSHLDIKQNKANHRKVDTLQRCQYHIQEYTKRELTNKDDILDAFAGAAYFYAKTTAKIASLAGIPIPFPFVESGDVKGVHLDHLSYALAWMHHIHKFSEAKLKNPQNLPGSLRAQLPWTPSKNPHPQRRFDFPSWSWAGWFGELEPREDLPYYWTSHLSSVRIGFPGDIPRDYGWLTDFPHYRHLIIQKLLTANELYFDAYVLNPRKLRFWERDLSMPSRRIPSQAMQVNMSRGPCSWEKLHQRLLDGELECVVIGMHGKPRQDVFKRIEAADGKAPKALKGRISQFEQREPDAIVCLIVLTVKGTSFRRGLLKIPVKDLGSGGGEGVVQALAVGPKRRFALR